MTPPADGEAGRLTSEQAALLAMLKAQPHGLEGVKLRADLRGDVSPTRPGTRTISTSIRTQSFE